MLEDNFKIMKIQILCKWIYVVTPKQYYKEKSHTLKSYRLKGHEFEQTPGESEGQGSPLY